MRLNSKVRFLIEESVKWVDVILSQFSMSRDGRDLIFVAHISKYNTEDCLQTDADV